MAAALRSVRRGWLIPAGLYAVPLAAALWLGIGAAGDAAAWAALFADTQFPRALALGLWVGLASTALSLACSLWLATRWHGTRAWGWAQAALGGLLALPHAAFAIGLALLLMPSGVVSRIVALAFGWSTPPDVATVQDPYGLALIAGLVLKETPFLLWNIAAQLQPVAQRAALAQQVQIAATLGYGARSAWARVVWPQLLPRLALPLLAVGAYGLAVVDMALVLGPTRPPTLALLAWQWLLDADPALNRQGAAAALLLGLEVVLLATAVACAWRVSRPWRARRWSRGDRPAQPATYRPGHRLAHRIAVAAWPAWLLGGIYAAIVVALVIVSLAGVWRYPALLPTWSLQGWAAVAASSSTVGVTALLALLAAATGLLLAVAWMETTPAHWDGYAALAIFAPMLVPGLLLVTGLYRLSLLLGIDGRFGGLWLAHSLYVAPYALVALAPAYRSYDSRYEQTAQALQRGRAAFLVRIKWPMLAAPLAAAYAIGFAVSVAQYLSTQFVGAGRYVTVTTEALTLAAGGQRTTTAAFALLQALLPALVFAAAAGVGRAGRHASPAARALQAA